MGFTALFLGVAAVIISFMLYATTIALVFGKKISYVTLGFFKEIFSLHIRGCRVSITILPVFPRLEAAHHRVLEYIAPFSGTVALIASGIFFASIDNFQSGRATPRNQLVIAAVTNSRTQNYFRCSPGDILVSINNTPLQKPSEVHTLLSGVQPSDTIRYTLIRNGQLLHDSITVIPEHRNSADPGIQFVSSLVITDVLQHSPAARAELHPFDTILDFGKTTDRNVATFQEFIRNSKGDTLHVKVKRHARILQLSLVPEYRAELATYIAGVRLMDVFPVDRTYSYTFTESISNAWQQLYTQISGKLSPQQEHTRSGPIGILAQERSKGVLMALFSRVQYRLAFNFTVMSIVFSFIAGITRLLRQRFRR